MLCKLGERPRAWCLRSAEQRTLQSPELVGSGLNPDELKHFVSLFNSVAGLTPPADWPTSAAERFHTTAQSRLLRLHNTKLGEVNQRVAESQIQHTVQAMEAHRGWSGTRRATAGGTDHWAELPQGDDPRLQGSATSRSVVSQCRQKSLPPTCAPKRWVLLIWSCSILALVRRFQKRTPRSAGVNPRTSGREDRPVLLPRLVQPPRGSPRL